MSPSVTLVGASGNTGSAALRSILGSHFSSLTALTRRPLPTPKSTSTVQYANVVVDFEDAATWRIPRSDVFVSCLGTIREKGAAYQRSIDVDLNIALATEAKRVGIETYILVSSMGASATSQFSALRMKGDLEEGVEALGFKHCIILRPGLIVRDVSTVRTFGEGAFIRVFNGLRAIGVPLDVVGLDGEDVGRAIANLARNPGEAGVRFLSNAKILAAARGSSV